MNKTVLIADDEASIVVSLEYLLGLAGYEVRIARDGVEALEVAQSFRPGLVLLDVMMPRMNGFDVCRRIREDPQLKGTRIVMLTAKGRDIEVKQGLTLGADAYVTKPFGTRDLMATIGGLMNEE